MPLFAAALVVIGPHGRSITLAMPVAAQPLWQTLADELAVAARALWARITRR